ncbi:hypothetical protein [Dactylosporangium sp. CS-033363]|uniref:hypothetical protein n=1 Tax=Dactylosporangium sp. CS-033363 TaxID=3239935 RepID=UPI003D8CC91D
MTSTSIVRTGAVLAPVLLFGYGALRLIDGLDGRHDKGAWMWNAGHVMFFAAMALLGALAVGVRRMLPFRDFRNRLIGNLAVVGTLAGMVAFLWVIVGDLFPSFADAAPLPVPLQIVGQAALVIGLVTLLTQLVRAGRNPAWSPIAALFAFLMIPVNLDLIPVAAVLLFVALLPLAGMRRRTPVSV